MKTKIIIIAVLAVLAIALGGGYYYYRQNQNKKAEEQKNEAVLREERVEESVEDKTAGTERETTQPPTPAVQEKPVGLISTTLMASLMSSAVTIGQTSYPADSVILLFYPGPGTYSVAQKVGSVWTTTMPEIKYSGSGGLNGGFLPSGIDNVQLKLQRIEGGKVVSESKVFTVKRADLTLGIKTYN